MKIKELDVGARKLRARWRHNPQRHEMRTLDNMHIKAKKDEVLKKLHENLEQHKTIVKEARDGYLEKATDAVEERLDQLAKGELVSLEFRLSPPQDYSSVYKQAILMMEMHTEDEIVLDAGQFRNLIQDKWDWRTHFLMENAQYSKTAAEVTKALGPEY